MVVTKSSFVKILKINQYKPKICVITKRFKIEPVADETVKASSYPSPFETAFPAYLDKAQFHWI
jgi:hypothetical protein